MKSLLLLLLSLLLLLLLSTAAESKKKKSVQCVCDLEYNKKGSDDIPKGKAGGKDGKKGKCVCQFPEISLNLIKF